MKNHTFLAIFLMLFSIFVGGMTPPKKVEAKSKIVAATVFNDRAVVRREFNHLYEPGIYRLHFSHLTATLMDQSVRVSGKGTADTVILNVKVKIYFKHQLNKL